MSEKDNSQFANCEQIKKIEQDKSIRIPYTTKIVKIMINGEIIWYANRWDNLLLNIKHIFVKPKHLNNTDFHKTKMVINPSFYNTIYASDK